MEIFPAIDLKDKKVVRLLQGDYDKISHYNVSPVDAARDFKQDGAKSLHIVDLDGARDGVMSNFEMIESVVKETDLFIEVGGGIRDEKRIEKYLSIGVGRVILGTAAVNDFEFLKQIVKKYKDRIAVGVDAKDGMVAVDGWLTVTQLDSVNFCTRVHDIGVKTVIYTDISKDGALSGTNLEAYALLNKINGLNIIASGGISYLDEIKKLRDMGTYGAIVGKAIYTGMLDLKKIISVANDSTSQQSKR